MISWVCWGTPAESPANRRRWISPQLGTFCDNTCSSDASGCRKTCDRPVSETSSCDLMKCNAHECVNFKHNTNSKHQSAKSTYTPTCKMMRWNDINKTTANTHADVRSEHTLSHWPELRLWQFLTEKSERKGITSCHATSWRTTPKWRPVNISINMQELGVCALQIQKKNFELYD